MQEIERLADDPRFVQVLLPVRSDVPYGNRRLPSALRGGRAQRPARSRSTPGGARAPRRRTTGIAPTYLEDYLSNVHIAEVQLLSLVAEGVFESFPELAVVFAECGFTWLPSLLWRFDKDWKGVWREVPWVRDRPSAVVRRHVRLTTAPAQLPPSPAEVAEVLEMVGPEMLLYASDAPHDHGASGGALLRDLDAAGVEAILRGNAEAFYRRSVA